MRRMPLDAFSKPDVDHCSESILLSADDNRDRPRYCLLHRGHAHTLELRIYVWRVQCSAAAVLFVGGRWRNLDARDLEAKRPASQMIGQWFPKPIAPSADMPVVANRQASEIGRLHEPRCSSASAGYVVAVST